MKNFISQNIKYLCEQEKLTQNEFGDLFDLGRSVIGMYVSEKSTPKIETIQKICKEFKISIDDFINAPLSEKESSVKESFTNEEGIKYGIDKEIHTQLEQMAYGFNKRLDDVKEAMKILLLDSTEIRDTTREIHNVSKHITPEDAKDALTVLLGGKVKS